MLRFTAYIEYLLMTRHYCYVPGHGAYMLSDEPALTSQLPCIGAGSRRLHTLEAPRRRVRFSPLHTHDDGILAQLLMEAEGMTYDEATRYIQRQAALLPQEADAADWADIDTDSYGFGQLQVETWADIEARQQAALHPEVAEAETAGPKADTIAIPRVWLQRAASIVLVILFFFTNFIGVHNGDTQMASIVDLSVVQRYAAARAALEAQEEPEEPTIPTIHLPEMPQKPAELQQAETRYYIIIGSYKTEAEAEACCRYFAIQDGLSDVGILAKKNLYRVYSASFGDREDALQYLRQLRKQSSRLKNAWLMPLKEESLSYIIKNKYNDNQLSMELSHPNPRTERDQG